MESGKAEQMTQQEPISKVHILRLHPKERRYLLIFGDFFMALIALFIALYYWAISHEWLGWSLSFFQERTPIWFYLLPLMWLILMVDLYNIERSSDWGGSRGGVHRCLRPSHPRRCTWASPFANPP